MWRSIGHKKQNQFKILQNSWNIGANILVAGNLKKALFFKLFSIILYDKSMWEISFISWNYEYMFLSTFSHFPSYLIRLQNSKVNVAKSAVLWLNYHKINIIEDFDFNFNYSGFLISNNLAFNGCVIIASFMKPPFICFSSHNFHFGNF